MRKQTICKALFWTTIQVTPKPMINYTVYYKTTIECRSRFQKAIAQLFYYKFNKVVPLNAAHNFRTRMKT